jgi:hypothetical protein
MTQAPLDKADIRLLTELGFLGAGAGLPRTVEKLFRAMMVIRPRRAFAYIGLATTHLNQSDPTQALQVMQQGVRMLGDAELHVTEDSTFDPVQDPAMMHTFHGLCLLANQRTSEATQVLQHVLELPPHPPALRLARGLLGLPTEPLAAKDSS